MHVLVYINYMKDTNMCIHNDADYGILCSVSQLVRDAQTMKEQRDAQLAELKTLAEQNGETAQHDFEKKVSECCYNTVKLWLNCFALSRKLFWTLMCYTWLNWSWWNGIRMQVSY